MQGPATEQPRKEGLAPKVGVITEEMKALLSEWEEKTKDINSLSCSFTRYEYDKVFAKETRSVGTIYFQNPDKGRIDFEPAGKALMALSSGHRDDQNKPFRVVAGDLTQWICTGKWIYVLNNAAKSYDRVEIPPEMQGQNITRSPLPFIFGMKAQDAMNRFALRLGDMHNPDGAHLTGDGKPMRRQLHIVANPFDPNVAREYTQAEILLNPETFLPMSLRTIDPAGNKETVYLFDPKSLNVGGGWGLKNPFKAPALIGWQLLNDGKAEPEQPPQQAQRAEK